MRLFWTVAAFTVVAPGQAWAQTNPGPYAGGWDYTWDFDDGTQGWTLNGSGAAWQASSGRDVSGALFLPDTSNATWNATALGLCGFASGDPARHRFILQADIYVGASNYLQGSGISVQNSIGKEAWVTGTAAGSQGMSAIDYLWGPSRSKAWGLAVGQWTTVQMDYGYSTPGYFWARYRACDGNAAGWTAGSWQEILLASHNPFTSSTDVFSNLMIGGGHNRAQTGWAQARYDNVRLAIVPEPSTLKLAILGIPALARSWQPENGKKSSPRRRRMPLA